MTYLEKIKVVLLVPKDADSQWAAIENIIKKGSSNRYEEPEETPESFE